MKTIYYNGMYIQITFSSDTCYVTDDFCTFKGITFKTLTGAKRAITKARNAGVEASR